MRGSFTAPHFLLSGGNMSTFQFYHVKEKYIRYLHSFDSRVMYK